MCKGQVGKLKDVGHMLGALGERDDVAVRHLLAVALLDGADSAEGIDDLARHGLQIAMDTVLVDILEGAGVHHGVLTELHLDHVEAEGLNLPDDGLDRAVSSTDGSAGGQRTLDTTRRSSRNSSALWYMVSVIRRTVAFRRSAMTSMTARCGSCSEINSARAVVPRGSSRPDGSTG